MLLLQIFLSFKDFKRQDYVETQEEDFLFNADMPMIVLCAKTPFTPPLPERFYVGLDPNAHKMHDLKLFDQFFFAMVLRWHDDLG